MDGAVYISYADYSVGGEAAVISEQSSMSVENVEILVEALQTLIAEISETSVESTEPTEDEAPTEDEVPTEDEAPDEDPIPVEPEIPGEGTKPTDGDIPTVPTEPVQPTEPVEPAEPSEPVEPSDPTEPEIPTEPVDELLELAVANFMMLGAPVEDMNMAVSAILTAMYATNNSSLVYILDFDGNGYLDDGDFGFIPGQLGLTTIVTCWRDTLTSVREAFLKRWDDGTAYTKSAATRQP